MDIIQNNIGNNCEIEKKIEEEQEQFLPLGCALEDIKTGDILEFNPKYGQVRKRNANK